jgi:hypothetical protein
MMRLELPSILRTNIDKFNDEIRSREPERKTACDEQSPIPGSTSPLDSSDS